MNARRPDLSKAREAGIVAMVQRTIGNDRLRFDQPRGWRRTGQVAKIIARQVRDREVQW